MSVIPSLDIGGQFGRSGSHKVRGIFGRRFDVDVDVLLDRYVKTSAEADTGLADFLEDIRI